MDGVTELNYATDYLFYFDCLVTLCLVNAVVSHKPTSSIFFVALKPLCPIQEGFAFQMRQEVNGLLQAETIWALIPHSDTKGANVTSRLSFLFCYW